MLPPVSSAASAGTITASPATTRPACVPLARHGSRIGCPASTHALSPLHPWTRARRVADDLFRPVQGAERDTQIPDTLHIRALRKALTEGTPDVVRQALGVAMRRRDLPALTRFAVTTIATRSDGPARECLEVAAQTLGVTASGLLLRAIAKGDSKLAEAAVCLDPCSVSIDLLNPLNAVAPTAARMAYALNPCLSDHNLGFFRFNGIVIEPHLLGSGTPPSIPDDARDSRTETLMEVFPEQAIVMALRHSSNPRVMLSAILNAPAAVALRCWAELYEESPLDNRQPIREAIRQRPDLLTSGLMICLIGAGAVDLVEAACQSRPSVVHEVNARGLTLVEAAADVPGAGPCIDVLLAHGAVRAPAALP